MSQYTRFLLPLSVCSTGLGQVFDGAHLVARQRADLALDTPIYNGHTTMAELLWAAVPVVTVAGHA